jgi:peptide/nickel transport system permease protein
MAWLMIAASAVILFNLLADITYGILDPRVRHD